MSMTSASDLAVAWAMDWRGATRFRDEGRSGELEAYFESAIQQAREDGARRAIQEATERADQASTLENARGAVRSINPADVRKVAP